MFNLWGTNWKKEYLILADQFINCEAVLTRKNLQISYLENELKTGNKPRKKRAKEITKRGKYHFVSQNEIVTMKAMFLTDNSVGKIALALNRSPSTISTYLHKMYDNGELEK